MEQKVNVPKSAKLTSFADLQPKGKVLKMSVKETNYIVADNILNLTRLKDDIKFKDLSNKTYDYKDFEI